MRRLLITMTILAATLAGAAAGPARAGIADQYGPAAAQLARGGGGACLENEAAALFLNPAGLAYSPFDVFSFGGQLGFPVMGEIEGVEWDEAGEDGPVLDEALPPHGLYLGTVKRILPPWRVGVSLNLPSQGIFYYEQSDPYRPSLVRWRNRAQRINALVGTSLMPIRGLSIGVSFELSVNAHLAIDYAWEGTDDGDEPVAEAVMRWAKFYIKPTVRPIIGIMMDFGMLQWRLEGLRFGFTYRNPVYVSLDPTELKMDLVNPGDLDPVFSLVDLVRATAVLTLIDFYTPRQLVWSLALDRPAFAAYVDVTWNQYSQFVANSGGIKEGREDEGGMWVHWNFPDDQIHSYGVVDGRIIPQETFRDTVTLRAGGEIRLGPGRDAALGRRRGVTIRFGGGYDPSFIDSQPGPTLLFDSPVITGALGAGLNLPDPLGKLAGNGSLDLGLQIHRALPVTHDKDLDLFPSTKVTPVVYEEQVAWNGGWMFAVGLTGTLRY